MTKSGISYAAGKYCKELTNYFDEEEEEAE